MDFIKYELNEPFPIQPTKPIMPRHNAGSAKVREYLKDLEEYESEMTLYKEEVRNFREKEQLLREEFKKDLFEELGIEDNNKREKLFQLAWEYGHSNGYYEVYTFAEDLVCLIVD